ncbi:hypothetical protein KEM55_002470, partial [Ascosphaera atra]
MSVTENPVVSQEVSNTDGKGVESINEKDAKSLATVEEKAGWTEEIERRFPTEAELQTLRRVPAKVPVATYSVAFVELCERFSYYGATVVCHVVLVVSAIPSVIDNESGAMAAFVLGVVVLGLGTGGFKSNVSVLIAEQSTDTHMYVSTTESGESIIVDPALTAARVYHYFYLMINLGGLIGQVSMVFAEKYVGFYLAYLLPTI